MPNNMIPPGGTIGQILTKSGPNDFEVVWADNAGGGATITADFTDVPVTYTGDIAQLATLLSGTLTFSRISGANLTVSGAGVVNLATALTLGQTVTLVARVQNTTNDAVEKAIEFTGVPAITLSALTLGTVTLTDTMLEGDVVAAILGATAGSTITMSGTAFSSNKLRVSGTNIIVGSAAASTPLTAGSTTGTFTLNETKARALNTPRASAQSSISVASGSSVIIPVNTGLPTLDNTTPIVGDYITGTDGTWDGSYTITRQYKRGSTVIPYADVPMLYVPANAATENITLHVTATSVTGHSTTVVSDPTAAVARTYTAGDYATGVRGIWSPCIGLFSGYTGNLIELTMDGVVANFGMASDGKGLLDVAAAQAWWALRASYTGFGGVMPRVTKIYNQAFSGAYPNATLASVAAEAPVLDFNLLRDDGLIPVAFNGYNARGFTQAGVAISPSEQGTTPGGNRLSLNTSGNLNWNASNFGISMVVEGLTNLGTSTSMFSLLGIAGTSATNNFALRSGNLNWSSNKGLGHISNTTVGGPASPLSVFAGRTLISAQMTTANTIDGVTPSANAVLNIRLNNQTGASFNSTYAIAGRGTSNVTSGTGWSVGCNATKAGFSGAAFGFYALAYYPNSHTRDVGGDNRNTAYQSLMKPLGVEQPTPTTHIMAIGSSSMTGYAGSVANGMMPRLQRRLGRKVAITNYAHAGAQLNTDILPVRVALSAQKMTGATKNIMVYYGLSADVGGLSRTDVQVFTDVMTMVTQFKTTASWDEVFICTHAIPDFAGDTTKQATLASVNAMIMNAGNQTTYGYRAIDIAAIPQLVGSALDKAWFDDGTHFRTEHGADLTTAVFEAAIKPYIV